MQKITKIHRLKISDGKDRAEIVSILARAGYVVSITEEKGEFCWSLSEFFVDIYNTEPETDKKIENFDLNIHHHYYSINEKDMSDENFLIDVLQHFDLVKDRSEGRRLILQGAIYVNGRKIEDIGEIIKKDDFLGGKLNIKKGKKCFAEIKLIN